MPLGQVEPEAAQSTASLASQGRPAFDLTWQKPETQESVDKAQKLLVQASPLGERHLPEGQVDPAIAQSEASSQFPPEVDLAEQMDEMQERGEKHSLFRAQVAPFGE